MFSTLRTIVFAICSLNIVLRPIQNICPVFLVLELKELKDATDWFSSYIGPLIKSSFNLDSFVNRQMEKNIINKSDFIKILQKADFNISNILLQKKETKDELQMN